MKENQTAVEKTIDYIEAHLKESIGLDSIARAAGYSKYHLNRIFAEHTGKTIHKYIQERRLNESADRLIATQQNIIEIAQDWGYASQQAYTLAFREYYQCTPQVYRQQNQKLTLRNSMKVNRSLSDRSSMLKYRSRNCKSSRLALLGVSPYARGGMAA